MVPTDAPRWQEFPAEISTERSSRPSAGRKRPRSISRVSPSICAALGGRVHAHHIGSAARWLPGWAEARNGQCGRKPFASTLGSHSLVGVPPRRGGTLSAHLHNFAEERLGGTPLAGNAAGDGHGTKGELAVRNGFSRDGARGCALAGAGLSSRIHGRCRKSSLALARVTVNVYLGDDRWPRPFSPNRSAVFPVPTT